MSEQYLSRGNKFLEWTPGRERRYTKAPIASEIWELHKDRIILLYIRQKKTLDEVVQILEVEGFVPSRRQLVAQIGKWKVRKYGRRQKMTASQRMEAERSTQGAAAQETTYLANGTQGPEISLCDFSCTVVKDNVQRAANECSAAIRFDENKHSVENEELDFAYGEMEFDFACGDFDFGDYGVLEADSGILRNAAVQEQSNDCWQQNGDADKRMTSHEGYGF